MLAQTKMYRKSNPGLKGEEKQLKQKPEIQRILDLVVALVICLLQNIMKLRQILYSNESYFIRQSNQFKLHHHENTDPWCQMELILPKGLKNSQILERVLSWSVGYGKTRFSVVPPYLQPQKNGVLFHGSFQSQFQIHFQRPGLEKLPRGECSILFSHSQTESGSCDCFHVCFFYSASLNINTLGNILTEISVGIFKNLFPI